MKPSLRKSLFVSVAALSLTCILCISGAFVFMEFYYFRQEEQRLRSEYLISQKGLMRSEVERAVDYIFYMKWKTDKRLRQSIKSHVLEAHAIATNLYNKYKGSLSKKEIGEMITAALRPFRYNSGRGYYFISDLKGTMILQPINAAVEGKDLSQWKDEDGVYIFQTAIDIVTRNGQGYFNYRWPKPGVPDKQFRKISYVKLFEPLGWYIGSGEYVDDVTRDIQAEVLARLKKVHFGNGGYIFAGQWDGLTLLGPGTGKNMWSATDKNGVKVVQELISAARKGGGYVEYQMPFESTADVHKLSYARSVGDWEWYVGAGVALDDIEVLIAAMRKDLYERLYQHLLLLAALFILLTGGVFVVSDRLSGRLGATVRDFLAFFDAARDGTAAIDPESQHYREFSEIALAANEMIDRRERAEVELGFSEKRFRLLFNAISDLILVYRGNPDGSVGPFFEFNEAACNRLGYSSDQMLVMNFDDILVEHDRGSVEKRIGREGFAVFETEVRSAYDTTIPVEVHARLFELAGLPTVMLICRDITDRQKAEENLQVSLEKYRALFDLFPFGITVTDENGGILEVNRESERLLGISSNNHTDRSLDSEEWRVVDPDGSPLEPQHFPASIALAESRVVRDQEIGVIRPDGKTAWLSVTAAPIPLEGHGVVVGYTDITERKRAEQSLKESEASLSTIFRAAPAGIGMVKDRVLTAVNERLVEMTGFPRENMIGHKTELFYCDKAEADRVGKDIYEQVRKKGFGSIEACWLHKSGQKKTVLLNAAALDHDNPMEIVFTALDLTDQIERETHYRVLFEGASDSILLLKDGLFVDCNEKALLTFGTTREAMIDASPADYSPAVTPDGRETAVVAQEKLGHALDGVPQVFEWVHSRPDGTLFDAEVSLNRVDLGGEAFVQAFVRDITARKRVEQELQESEAKFRRLVEDLGDRFCLFRYDMNGMLTYLSPSGGRVFGVDAETIVGTDWKSALNWGEDIPTKAREHTMILMQGEVASTTYEGHFTHPDGSLRTIEVTKHILRDEDGNPQGIEGIVVDVTERATAQEELQEYGDKLEHMVRERTEKLSVTVNELKTRNEESSTMARFGDLLQVCETDEESHGIMASICTQLFAGHSGYLALLDESTKCLVAVSGFGDFDWRDVEFEMQDCWSLRRGRPHVIADPSLDPACPHMGKDVPPASICMPVEARGEYLGLLHIRLNLGDELGGEMRQRKLNSERDLARRVAELYSLSLANIRLREKLRIQSIRDPLTGLFNRRHMEASLTREIDRARRRDASLGVILMDVDHFKRFNDTHGHDAGDEVLRKLGSFLHTHTRGEDIPCRYGGEELIVILPDCSPENCRQRAEQIRKGIEELEISYNSTKLKVTVSLGAATYPINGELPEDVISAADLALYRAKENGRNRVEKA